MPKLASHHESFDPPTFLRGEPGIENEACRSSDLFIPGFALAPPVPLDEPASAVLPAGTLLGHYRIRGRIGSGGMGVVYEAVDIRLARKVAIKVLRSEAGGAFPEERLLTEARASACLEHERFARVYAVDTLTNGLAYMVMEYLEGTTLRHWLPRRRPPATVAMVFYAIVEGLAFAHRRGIVHRDLKPENIFLTEDNKVKILDLGLAGLTEPARFSTVERAELPLLREGYAGTPRYFAPETWHGAPPTPQVDVWAVGVMLYEALSGGQHPFWINSDSMEANTQRVLAADYRSRLGPLEQTPIALRNIIWRALAPTPAARYADAGELLATLRRWMEAAAIAVPSSSLSADGELTVRRRWRPHVSHRVLGGAALAVVIGTSVCTAVSWSLHSGMAELPGGTFTLGSTKEEITAAVRWCEQEAGDPLLCARDQVEREQPQHQVTLAAFFLDRTEVTNREFAAWLNRLLAHQRIQVDDKQRLVQTRDAPTALLADLFPSYHPSIGLLFDAGQFSSYPGSDDKPVSQVTWEAARRYCADHGKRLPTEAEWEYAARGAGKSSFRFPWGNEDPRCEGVVAARDEIELPAAAGKDAKRIPYRCLYLGIGPAAVRTSTQDVSPQGVYDLGGNVSEWVQDPFIDRYVDCGTCINPLVPDRLLNPDRPQRVFRGGSWGLLLAHTRSAGRSRYSTQESARSIGFRCAKTRPLSIVQRWHIARES